MKPIEMKEGARRDLRDAVAWYRSKDRDLPARFLAAFSQAIDRIEAQPDTGLPMARGTRSLKIKRFPFRIVFREETSHTMIFAVAHDRRRPDYWLKRVPRNMD